MSDAASSSNPAVYQLRVVLAGICPLIWRRLLVPAEATIAEVHAVLQVAFGWGGEHLHRFVIHGTEYGISYLGGPGFRDDARGIRLGELGLRGGALHLPVQRHCGLAGRPASRADPARWARPGLLALCGWASGRPTRGVGRSLGVWGTDTAVPGVRRDRPRGRDDGPVAGSRRPGPAEIRVIPAISRSCGDVVWCGIRGAEGGDAGFLLVSGRW